MERMLRGLGLLIVDVNRDTGMLVVKIPPPR